MRCASRPDTASSCAPTLTLSALPGAAPAVLTSCPGEACCFSFVLNHCSDPSSQFVRIDTYIPDCTHVYNELSSEGSSLSLGSPGRRLYLFIRQFFRFLFWSHALSLVSEPSIYVVLGPAFCLLQ